MHQWKETACVKLDEVGGQGGLDELAKPDLFVFVTQIVTSVFWLWVMVNKYFDSQVNVLIHLGGGV